MATLLIRCEAPLQSWGYQSRFSNRDTGAEPTKSGIVGLLCNALGIDRSIPPTAVPLPGLNGVHDLTRLRMGVRVDREGAVCKDYHTVGGGKWKGRPYGVIKATGSAGGTVLSDRYYLMDALFLVGLEGDVVVLKALEQAIRHPIWPLFLGRRSCPPSEPLVLPNGLSDSPLPDALRNYPRLHGGKVVREGLRWVLEAEQMQGDVRLDRPVEWADTLNRVYHPRYVRTTYEPAPFEVFACS